MNYKLVDEITGKGYERTKEAEYEHWYKDGELHRLDGPAWICYENGNVTEVYWYKDSERLSKEHFTSLDMINQLKAYSLFTPIEIVRHRLDTE